jgi:hypothetical protein
MELSYMFARHLRLINVKMTQEMHILSLQNCTFKV